MKNEPISIQWNDEHIGFIEDVKIDGVRIYGRWKPTKNNHYQNFKKHIEINEDPLLRIGTDDTALHGHLGCIEGELIEICIT